MSPGELKRRITRFGLLLLYRLSLFYVLAGLLLMQASAAWAIPFISSLELRPSQQELVLQGSEPLSKPASIKRLTKTKQLIIELPNVTLANGAKRQDIPLNEQGFVSAYLQPSKAIQSGLTLTLTVQKASLLDRLTVSSKSGKLLISPDKGTLHIAEKAELTSRTVNKPSTSFGSKPSTVTAKQKPWVVDTKQPVVSDVFVQGDTFTLKSSQPLTISKQFSLKTPSRLVYDIAPARLSNRELAGTIPLPSSWQARSIRVGQFTDNTVRLVLEASSGAPTRPSDFHWVPASTGKAHTLSLRHRSRMNTVHPDELLTILPKGSLPPTKITNVSVSQLSDSGTAVIKIETEKPLASRLHHQANKVYVDLLNVSSAKPSVQFNTKPFPYLNKARQERVSAGKTEASRLVLTLAKTPESVIPTLSKDGKSLSLSVKVADSLIIKKPIRPIKPDSSSNKAPWRAHVVVDAGHGGKDQGASRAGVLEKRLNLMMAKRIAAELRKKGLKVTMTRTTDRFLELKEISDFANARRPNLFISVHHNSSNNPSLNGLETYYYHGRSLRLARTIHKRLVGRLRVKDNKVRRAKFYVINHTTMPAILLELGYISNRNERGQLVQATRQQKAAEAVANGVVDYLKKR